MTRNLMNIKRGLYFVADIILQTKPDIVINLGDTFNNPDVVTTRSLVTAYSGFKHIQEMCRETNTKHYMLDGNHDILNSNFSISNTKLLNGFCDEVIDDFSMFDIEDIRIGFVPYHNSQIQIHDWIGEAIDSGCDFVCAHCEFASAIYENGMKSESMMKTNWGKPIFSGHIHLPQIINDVTYVGSLVQSRFDSTTLNKNGVMVYDTDTQERKRYFNSSSKHLIKIRDIEALDTKYIKNIVGQIIITGDADRELVTNKAKDIGLEDFIIVKKYEQKTEEEQVHYSEFSVAQPKDLLRTHIELNNSDAIDVFENICEV